MQEEMISCHTLICGATSFGLGLAATPGADALIVEKGTAPVSEFIGSFRPGEEWNAPLQHPHALAWREKLRARNVLSEDNRIHLPPLHPLFCEQIKQQGLRVLFLTDIVEVRAVASGYEVVLITHAGLQRVKAKHIIDTTSMRASWREAPVSIEEKSINALLHTEQLPETITTLHHHGRGSIQAGRFPTEAYLRLSIEKRDCWTDAREKLYQYWSERPSEWQHWTIAAVADTFDVRVPIGPHQVRKNWFWLPSSAYSNVLVAYEAGLLYASMAEV